MFEYRASLGQHFKCGLQVAQDDNLQRLVQTFFKSTMWFRMGIVPKKNNGLETSPFLYTLPSLSLNRFLGQDFHFNVFMLMCTSNPDFEKVPRDGACSPVFIYKHYSFWKILRLLGNTLDLIQTIFKTTCHRIIVA